MCSCIELYMQYPHNITLLGRGCCFDSIGEFHTGKCVHVHGGVDTIVCQTRILHIYEEVVGSDRRDHDRPACSYCEELWCNLKYQSDEQVVQKIARGMRDYFLDVNSKNCETHNAK